MKMEIESDETADGANVPQDKNKNELTDVLKARAGEGEIKCCIVGDGGVGKTSMLLSYTTGKMLTNYEPTCFESYVIEVKQGETTKKMFVMDTAGQETYDRLRTLSYYDTDVFIVCFSVDDQDSFDNVRTRWIPEIKEFRPNTPFIMVGTQTDLRHSVVDITDACVSSARGKKAAKKLGAKKYIECSSVDGQGTDYVFEVALKTAQSPVGQKKIWKSIKRAFRKKDAAV
ncbi:hypothetical protein FSP39_015813 [Pinctada imbricata]|uniref:Uncharacterized protein n=1 Tax=Pinctada imbricata TaxID=66713 RepID=A0AA88XZ77_PINIB|nr:hypothetical protein FSP39_015813 [Pinctada imbricata]